MYKIKSDINEIYFPDGVRSVYIHGKRIKKEDIQIERCYNELLNSDIDCTNLPEHIKYLPRKQAAVYLGLSESTLIRYHEKGKLKWITRRNRTPIYSRELLDKFKQNNN
tara:strand:- start:21589 stop:21915 length:327 start_codon:yes stop_codon:yes gene_type:complete